MKVKERATADLVEWAHFEAASKEESRRKDEFLAILAHELRNPLAPIRFATAILCTPGVPEARQRQAATVIERQAAHMARLLDDLLDVTRIARGTVQLKRERVDLAKVLQPALEAARPLIESKEHALEVRVPEGATLIDADPARITQIVANLLTNAAKYTRRRGRIAFEARVEGGEIVMVVTDNGMGFDAHLRARLFTLFVQATSAREASEGGLVIGLALAKSFAELHGGRVEAHSEGPGLGSRFVVRLPVYLPS